MPGQEQELVSLSLAGIRDAFDNQAHFVERNIPEQLIWLASLDPCRYQRRPVYPAVAVLGRASPPLAAFGCISSKAFAISVPASS